MEVFMKNLSLKLLSILILAICAMPKVTEAHGGCFATTPKESLSCVNTIPVCKHEQLNSQQRRNFCNAHNRRNCLCLHKVKLGEPFTPFCLVDINNQTWCSSKMLGKPVIILAGHRSRRWEIGKWAECLNKDFRQSGLANVIWVNELMKTRYHTVRDEQYSMWRAFKSPIPVVMDWDNIIGTSLKIDYGKPNIIVIDQCGRLVMHEIKLFDYGVYASVSNCIKNLCNNTLVCMFPAVEEVKVTAPVVTDLKLETAKLPKQGKKGDSL